jgi:cob(I)alamin adenosyltransferase
LGACGLAVPARAIRGVYTAGVKIYTRRGDSGETDLFGGSRVGKDHPRVEAYGSVDELCALAGLCAATSAHADLQGILRDAQGQLLGLGADLASEDPGRRERDGGTGPRSQHVVDLENHIDALEAELEPLKRFILPGGTPAAAALHVARTVCRRAERRLVELHRDAPVSEIALRYLNRLSDLLFVMARIENRRAGEPDVEWRAR